MAGSSSQWPPLLSEVLAEITSADSLVRWGLDAQGLRKVVGLRELRVAALLFACSQEEEERQEGEEESSSLQEEAEEVEEAAEQPPSRKFRGLLNTRFEEERTGVASLLDLALRFGHADLARRLFEVGLEQRRLEPTDLQCLPVRSLAGLPEYKHLTEWHRCSKEEALRRWYPAVERQSWASDWDAPLLLARLLVDAPATRAALALASEGVRVGLSEKAESRLLDAALLLGDPGAAAALAARCGQQPPMRAWDKLRIDGPYTRVTPGHAEAFLRAGQYGVLAAELGGDPEAEPARKALRVAAEVAVQTGSVSLAQAVRGAAGAAPPQLEFELPGSALVGPKADDGAAHAGRREWEVRRAKLEVLEVLGAAGAGCTTEVEEEVGWVHVPVLFLAVLLGDETAAWRLVHAGHSFLRLGLDSAELLSADELRLDDDDDDYFFFDVDLPSGRLETMERTLGLLFAVAARRCLAGLAATGRCCLLGGQTGLLVRVAGFGAVWSEGDERVRQEASRLIGRDPLANFEAWQRAAAARTAAELPPSELSMEADGGAVNEGSAADLTAGQAPEPQGSPAGEPPASSSVAPSHAAEGAEGSANEKDDVAENEELSQALQQSELEAVQAEQQHVQRAVLESKSEAFNDQVYALLRLTKRSREISEHLLTSQELLPCRQRVQAAGCELRPEWAGGALLLVPMTPELYVELGLELLGHHVLMLESDASLLEAALKALPKRRRPGVRWDHRAEWYDAGAAGPGQEEASDGEGSPPDVAQEESEERQHGEAPREESAEQERGEAAGVGGEAEVGSFRAAADADWMRRYGIVKERIHIPADNFDLSVASPGSVPHSAPAGASCQGEDAAERLQQPVSGSGLHAINPRHWWMPFTCRRRDPGARSG